ncbi:Mov34/MPN/PAD-1 family protein [Candidatus Micrarchaeota archaeon]|nr:Mov34/MPN/PAD-1 family protein [Candidatus Micrarchaeota archaeon]
MGIFIKKNIIKSISHIAQQSHPKEFIGLLSGKKEKQDIFIEKLIIPSGGISGKGFASYPIYRSPYNTLGTVHSHPSIPLPSKADLNLFSTNGIVHIIIGFPYLLKNIKIYSNDGTEIKEFTIIGEKNERS